LLPCEQGTNGKFFAERREISFWGDHLTHILVFSCKQESLGQIRQSHKLLWSLGPFQTECGEYSLTCYL
jgi:hypothetical protein